ncbi:unnamed protein product [Timema podura]|uniref:RRM domain-containing protein n=3 Tax=Timema TaxID=61471 RepID=A0A7R9FIB1_9NEOP|nr:unnamed protein product [Timema tahoe]CAD7589600.1 unnamed protein product [Timema genevievae]CAG2058309.1 unnamed protein product [Timema podura]
MSYYNDYQGGTGNAAGNGQARGTAGIPGKDDDRKLFVGGLSRQTTDRELKDYFGKFGEIESVTIKVDPYTGQSRGFAFIVFTDAKTIDKLTSGDHYINKRKVDPKRVSKKSQQGKIFVGGLTPEISDADIKNYFGQYGAIVEVQAPFDKIKNQRKGFCFITFESKETVWALLKNPKQFINGKEVDVKKVKVNPEGMGPAGRGAGRGMGWQAYGGYAGFGGGYPQDFGSGYGTSGYDVYDYGGGYDYSGSYYDSGAAGGVYGAKPRGGGTRSFLRHQPY